MKEPGSSRDIPLPIEREVRKRCGFGCVVCGRILYIYHHMEGWSDTHRHDPQEITLLCDKHHTEATKGLLTKEQVAQANKAPYNLKKGASTPYLIHLEGDTCEIDVGGNDFSIKTPRQHAEIVALMVDGLPLLGFVIDEGQLLFNMNLFDENNMLVLQVVRNNLRFSVALWDIEFVGRTLTIREKSRKILVKMEFNPPNRVSIIKGRFLFNGVEILVDEERILVVNNAMLFERYSFVDGQVGLCIGLHPAGVGCGMYIRDVNRYQVDRKASLDWVRSLGRELDV
jgi:hypothetical protein